MLNRLPVPTLPFTSACSVVGPLLSQLNSIPTAVPTSTLAPTATPLATIPTATIPDMQSAAGALIDGQVFQMLTRFNKPVGLSARYLSAAGAATQCISAVGQSCKPFDDFAPARPDDGAYPIDLNHQANIYYALLAAVNDRAWIAGFNAWGYYPPVVLRDRWLSVRGKPAETVVAAWYHKWTGR